MIWRRWKNLVSLCVISSKVSITAGSYARKFILEYLKGLPAATTGNIHPRLLHPSCFLCMLLMLVCMAFLFLFLKTFLGCGISLTHWDVLREDRTQKYCGLARVLRGKAKCKTEAKLKNNELIVLHGVSLINT